MMEAILNLLWLAVALAAGAVWRYRWVPARSRSRSRTPVELIALVCALGLLFPSVSLTDDLHPQIVAVDAASGKRNGSHLLSGASHAHCATRQPMSHLVAALLTSPAPLAWIDTSSLVLVAGKIHPQAAANDYDGRSPPSTVL